MKITVSLLAVAAVAPASAFVLPVPAPHRILLSALHSTVDDKEDGQYSRRSFVNHVVTATAA
eukprot:scaffold558_cov69-Amphora_coffeaeformis.AAC.1